MFLSYVTVAMQKIKLNWVEKSVDDIIIPKNNHAKGSLLFFCIIDDINDTSDHLVVICSILGNNAENVEMCDKQKPKFYTKKLFGRGWLLSSAMLIREDVSKILMIVLS